MDLLLAPVRRLLSGLLRTYLAAYFETGAGPGELRVDELGVLGDDLVLQHLSLRADVLSALLPAGLPLRFASGYVRELRIQVPWTRLLSAPVTLTLRTVALNLDVRAPAADAAAGAAAPLSRHAALTCSA